MTVSVVLFTADLRLHDHPPLWAALDGGGEVVPLFVRDEAIAVTGFTAPNREAFLADALSGLDAGLRERGGRLVVRSGDLVEEVRRVCAETGAGRVHLAAGVSRFARSREQRLRGALESDGRGLRVHEAVITAVPPGAITPPGADHYAVFTPYFRHWSQQRLRVPLPAPPAVRVPGGIASDPLPSRAAVRGVSAGLPAGGEGAARALASVWQRGGLAQYAARHDDLPGDATSRLSPYLHFGCLSATELVRHARTLGGEGAEAFVRQVCWRDFHHQVLAARPTAATAEYRTHHDRWRGEEEAAQDIEAWKRGLTGYPVVDAAMRQLAHEGWMHNRGRLLTASFLTKTLYVDWRIGARYFLELLVDGDLANNQLNWQWMAGTGTDTRPERVLNPMLQAQRYDPEGDYVRRWIPELAGIEGPQVHEPWKLPGLERLRYDYPDPIIELSDGLARFKEARSARK